MLPIVFKDQIVPGTFEYALSHIVDNELDLSSFESRYKNDKTGAPAFDPKILLKIILYAYSRGIISSRKIARCCEENIIFMALAADTRPHFTTISDFISSIEDQVVPLFQEVLLICEEMDLIGKNMFAIDGCKISSNASKEWSGTRDDFKNKKEKFERAIVYLVKKHKSQDKQDSQTTDTQAEKKAIEKLKSKSRKIKKWLKENKDKPGKNKKVLKSNITDNESAKMKSSHGVIQGYIGVSAVDDKHQVIVSTEAYGQAQEHDLLKPVIENTRENFKKIGTIEDVFKITKITADSGFHSNIGLEMLFENKIDAYVADNMYRKRDPRFVTAGRHKNKMGLRTTKKKSSRLISRKDFILDPKKGKLICPAGKELKLYNRNLAKDKGIKSLTYKAKEIDCQVCTLKDRCLRKSTSKARHVIVSTGRKADESWTEKMKKKIDTVQGRLLYSKRMGIVEPVFGNITHAMGLNKFTLRGRSKINTQWKLYCMVHNLKKIFRYGLQAT